MQKPILALSLLTLTALAPWQERARPVVPLGVGTLIIEHVAGGEAVLKIEAESEEQLENVRVRAPDGRRFLELERSDTHARGVSGLVMELRESSLAELRANYAEGAYEIRADTVGGRVAVGAAELSFDLPAVPELLYPAAHAVVPRRGLTVLWKADAEAVGYRLQLEQNESDGLVVNLPAGRSSFRVPAGVVAPGVETHLELAAIGANGNRTMVELIFTARP